MRTLIVKTEHGTIYTIFENDRGVFASRLSEKEIKSAISDEYMDGTKDKVYKLSCWPRPKLGETMILELDEKDIELAEIETTMVVELSVI